MDCSTPGFPVLHHFSELVQTHVHWVSDTIQPSYPLVIPFSSCLQSFPTSGSFLMSGFFVSGGQSIETSSSVLLMNIQDWFSFRIGWFDLLTVQGTLKSLLQHHRSKASILWHSAFFMVQFSHPYMTTGKTIALTRQTFVGKVMSLLDLTKPACIPSSALSWPIDMTFNLYPPWVSKMMENKWSLLGFLELSEEDVFVVSQMLFGNDLVV